MSQPVIFFKAIKEGTLNQAKINAVLQAEAEKIAADMELDLLVTTATWKRDVKFEHITEIKGEGITILVGTNDPIWDMLNKGTQPHVILPRNASVLHFKGTYTAKTIPGVLTARPGGSSGKDIFSQGVIHPGTEARKWDQALEKKWRKKLPDRVEKAISRALNEAYSAKGM